MIPQANIVEWSNGVPWPTIEQVEQDLLLSRLIIEIAEDPYLGKELAFRGGTCLHKLHIVPGLRYSEDLDYVRRTADGIGDVFDALRAIGDRLGMEGHTARRAPEGLPARAVRVRVWDHADQDRGEHPRALACARADPPPVHRQISVVRGHSGRADLLPRGARRHQAASALPATQGSRPF